MPLHATSSGVCHFEWRMPLQVAHATSSGVSHREHATSCRFKWRMPLQVACRTVSMPLHATSCYFKWRPHREHATSCHFKWRSHREHATSCHFMPLQVAWSGVKWRNRFTHVLRAQCKSFNLTQNSETVSQSSLFSTWSRKAPRNLVMPWFPAWQSPTHSDPTASHGVPRWRHEKHHASMKSVIPSEFQFKGDKPGPTHVYPGARANACGWIRKQ